MLPPAPMARLPEDRHGERADPQELRQQLRGDLIGLHGSPPSSAPPCAKRASPRFTDNSPMRMSRLFGRTLREAPTEAQTPGHQLMLRAAIARPLAAGLYTWLPLGFRVARKVEQIIREEQDRIGAQEVRLPVITPAEYWKETGRWDTLEPVSFRTKDHNGRDYMIGYTHEELVMHHARNEILSYRQLPAMVYHFQEKGRDEERPRAGLLRVREFVMKDAYSIDRDWEGLDKQYWAQHGAYAKTFARMGLKTESVESDTGNMCCDV